LLRVMPKARKGKAQGPPIGIGMCI
jgi:hypothetical protein